MSAFDPGTGVFGVPSRTTAVFVEGRPATEQTDLLIDDVQDLVVSGALNPGQGTALTSKLLNIRDKIERGQIEAALNQLGAFINQVEAFVSGGVLTPAEGAALIEAAEDIMAALMP
jgi:hypothetical protein